MNNKPLRREIDLNCDLGEGMATDAAIMPFISSANIACGFHAGDTDTMKRTVALCLEHGVAIGAHPGFDDQPNFGRVEQQLPAPGAYYDLIIQQLQLMQRVAAEEGAAMHHVKPHGALYNMSARDAAIAKAIAQAVFDVDKRLVLFGLAGSVSVTEANKLGLKTVHEFFADRTYQPDGSLTPRSRPDALITNHEQAVAQALTIASEHRVKALNGEWVAAVPDDALVSICLHGDGAHAIEFARLIHQALSSAGFRIAASS